MVSVSNLVIFILLVCFLYGEETFVTSFVGEI